MLKEIFNKARKETEIEIKNFEEKAKTLMNGGKDLEELINIVSNKLDIILKTVYKDLNEK